MAKVKLNSLLADVRGRLGSLVFSNNGSGFNVSVYRPPVNPRTSLQSQHRNTFSLIVRAWSVLSPAERALWSSYAAQLDNVRYDWFGDPYYPSSRAQFISINSSRIAAGEPLSVSPPTGALPAVLPGFEGAIYGSLSASTSFINPLAAFDASVHYVHLSCMLTFSAGRSSRPGPFRFIAVAPSAGPWPYDLSAWCSASFGLIPPSGRYFFSLVPLSSEFRPGSPLFFDNPVNMEYP